MVASLQANGCRRYARTMSPAAPCTLGSAPAPVPARARDDPAAGERRRAPALRLQNHRDQVRTHPGHSTGTHSKVLLRAGGQALSSRDVGFTWLPSGVPKSIIFQVEKSELKVIILRKREL